MSRGHLYQPVCHDPINSTLVYQSSSVYHDIVDAYTSLCNMPMELAPYYRLIYGDALPFEEVSKAMHAQLSLMSNIMQIDKDVVFRYVAPGSYYDVETARVTRFVFEVAPLIVVEKRAVCTPSLESESSGSEIETHE